MVYIDTSVAVKLVRPEAHSQDLSGWVGEMADTPFVSSVLIEVELIRATRRVDPGGLVRAAAVLAGIGVVTLSPAFVARTTGDLDPDLRSIDAIHLATAGHVASTTTGVLTAFLGYDEHLLAAARHFGLPIMAPGVLRGPDGSVQR